MDISINLNEIVKFKLTDYGKDIFYHRFDKVNPRILKRGGKPIKPSMPKEDINGYSRMQLWDFMAVFGPYMGLGLKEVVQPLEIIYETGVES